MQFRKASAFDLPFWYGRCKRKIAEYYKEYLLLTGTNAGGWIEHFERPYAHGKNMIYIKIEYLYHTLLYLIIFTPVCSAAICNTNKHSISQQCQLLDDAESNKLRFVFPSKFVKYCDIWSSWFLVLITIYSSLQFLTKISSRFNCPVSLLMTLVIGLFAAYFYLLRSRNSRWKKSMDKVDLIEKHNKSLASKWRPELITQHMLENNDMLKPPIISGKVKSYIYILYDETIK